MEKKRIETKREVIDVKEVYVAVDGTEFDAPEECKKYEKSAVGVLKGRLHQMALFEGTECDLFDGAGSDENNAYVVAPKNEEDVKTCQQVAHMLAWSDDWKKKHAEKVAVGKVLAVVIEYGDNAAWIIDLGDVISNATSGKYGIAPVEAK